MQGSASVYSGTVSLTSVEVGGAIVVLDTTLDSTIDVVGDWNGVLHYYRSTLDGTIDVFGDWNGSLRYYDSFFNPDATISIGGKLAETGSFTFSHPALDALRGTLLVGQDSDGAIEVEGNMAGETFVGGSINGSVIVNGDITGTLTVGALHGNLCADNLSATQALPLNIAIGCGIGPAGTICGQAPVCPAANIATAVPASGTRDARQPYPEGTPGTPVPLTSRQGIGSPNPDAREEDKIKLTLSASGLRAISHNCWSLCETWIEPVDTGTPPLSSNKISCIKEPVVAGNQYQIVLDRPISAKNWTRIKYVQGGQMISYASLPSNVNGDNYADPLDILEFIDCCMNRVCGWQPDHLLYRCDLDHSGDVNPADQLTFLDLRSGAGTYIVWDGKTLPPNTCAGGGSGGGGGDNCANSDCGGGTDPMAMASGGGGIELESTLTSEGASDASVSSVAENAYFADWFVNYLTTTNPADSSAEEAFLAIVDSLAQWCVDQFTPAEQAALAARLSDASLTFASESGRSEAAIAAEAISP